MSIKHMTDVWDDPRLSSSEKLVALAIADCANDNGMAWPGYKNLMKKTGIRSKVTISKIIKLLREKGWLSWSNNSDFGVGKKVNLYQILPKSTETVPPPCNTPKRFKSTETVPPPPGTETVPPKVQKLYPKSTETVHETSLKRHIKENRQSFAQESFESFWEKYPKKKSKGTARKAWKKIGPGKKQTAAIMNGLSQAINSKDWEKENGKYIPHPATWLNGEGWEDEDSTTYQPPKDYARIAKLKEAERERIRLLKEKKDRAGELGVTC